MADVIDLASRRPEETHCFECACGCQLFVLRPDARVQCRECHVIMPSLIWGQFFQSDKLPPVEHKG